MNAEEIQGVVSAIAKKDAAIGSIIDGILDNVRLLEILGLAKTDIARKLGLMPAERGRPRGSRTKKSTPTVEKAA